MMKRPSLREKTKFKSPPVRLILVGGGHSHAIALKLWGENPLPGVEVSLISDVEQTPYSGMLPGHVAGFYDFEQTHLNLAHLARNSGVDLVIDRAVDLDLEQNLVICQHNPAIPFDYLSLDIGSTPKKVGVPGAEKYAIAAKPVPLFLQAWSQLLTEVVENPENPLKIAIIGGGAGGVELALNMQTRLAKIQGQTAKFNSISVIHRGERLLPGHNLKVSRLLSELLQQKSIRCYLKTEVSEIAADRVICQSGQIIDADYIFWVTQADSPDWIKNSSLAKDDRGFIAINQYLQSISHPNIFAAGDIATMKGYPRPKAGVFAVRQGKPLYRNWQNIILDRPLQAYIPQDKYLALIGTGTKSAIASWHTWCWQSPLLWLLKDYIDRQFMKQFK